MTGVGLRWKSLKRQERVEAGAGWKRSNMSLSLSLWSRTSFCFAALIRLTYSILAHFPSSHFFKTWEALSQHHACHHHHHHHHHHHPYRHRNYPHCHRFLFFFFFGYTQSSFKFNWQLEVAWEAICFSPVGQPPPPPLLPPCSFLSRVTAAWCE